MPNDTNKLRRRIMRRANYILQESPSSGDRKIDSSYALTSSWWFESFRDKLSNGFARFTYRKMDGTIRQALGTLAPSLIPVDKMPNSLLGAPDVRPEVCAAVPYYDLDKDEWRSFNVLNFISLDKVWPFNDPGTSSRQTGGVASAEKG